MAGMLCSLALALSTLPSGVRIHVVSHGWHTGLVLPLTEEVLQACPPLEDFRGHRAVEIGWGDEGFYRASSISFGTAFRAVFWPTPTVLHVVAVDRPVLQEFWASDVVALDLTAEGFGRLVAGIAGTFAGGDSLGRGLYGESLFYRARGSYYFPQTCNVWTLRMLGEAGVATRPLLGTRAPAAMAQLAEAGTVLRMAPADARWPYGLAWLAGVVAALWGQARSERQGRRSWWTGTMLAPWLVALVGVGLTLGLLLTAANHPQSRAMPIGIRLGLGLICLGMGVAAGVSGRRMGVRIRPASTLSMALSLVWILLVMAGA